MLYQGSDGQVHVLGDGEELKHWKYIKKIKTGSGWRYFYSQDEINAYVKEVQGAAKGVKNKIDSVPRLQKHGDKYYIADKKTQRNIEKSGVGGNVLRRNKKGDVGRYKAYKLTDNTVSRATARDRMAVAKGKQGDLSYYSTKNNIRRIAATAQAASEASKVKARESAYSKYEAKNVVNRKLSDIKKKLKKKNKGKNKVNIIKEKKIKEKKITENKIKEKKIKEKKITENKIRETKIK